MLEQLPSTELGEIRENITKLVGKIQEISQELNELMGSSIRDQLESKNGELVAVLETINVELNEIEQIYSEFQKIRKMLDEAFVEESNASFRIANEFSSLQDALKRISYELVYIKEEKQKLLLKVKKEYPAVPLPDLLATTETYNGSWLDLVGNSRIAQLNV